MGDEMILVTLEPPETFGELASADDQPRSATVVTLIPTTLLSLSSDDFRELAAGDPAIAQAMLRSLGL